MMNNALKAVIPVAALGLALTACGGGSDHGGGVKGKVEGKQVEYDCKTKHHAMSLSAFALPMKPGGRSGSKSRSGSGSNGSGGGVKKPKKIDKIPVIPDGPDYKPGKKLGKSCKAEYELFIRNKDGLFEEDVRAVHYDSCGKDEKYPECTK